jgi:hypothetical protein
VIEKKMDMVHCHTSQMYEWIPYNQGVEDEVPQGEAERREWMVTRRVEAFRGIADKYRDRLVALYGEEHGSRVEHAEAFEVCEYGSALTDEKRKELFPFLPNL